MNRWYQGRDDDDDDASECVNGSHSETIVFFFYRAHSEESHEARCNSQHGSPWLGVPVQLLLVISLLYSLYILRLWVVGCIPGPNSKARIYMDLHLYSHWFQPVFPWCIPSRYEISANMDHHHQAWLRRYSILSASWTNWSWRLVGKSTHLFMGYTLW